jgi:integrase
MGDPVSTPRLAARPAARRKDVGVTRLQRKAKDVYRLAFSYQGAQCRELLALKHSAANDAYVRNLRAEIMAKIARREFVYADYFPESTRATMGARRSPTLRAALEAYRDRVQHTLEPSTFAGYRKAVDNVLVPWCGHMLLSDLRPADIRDWMAQQRVSLKRIRNVLLPLRAVLSEAVADELIDYSPLDRVDLAKLVPVAKRSSSYEPQPYTVDELHTLLSRLPEPERHTFSMWAYTGLRTGELIALRWPRVDLEARTIRIIETTTERQDKDRPKTKAGIRTVPLLPAAWHALQALRPYTQLAGDRVNCNPRSTRPDRAWDDKRLAAIWQAAHKGTGIAYRAPYVLRLSYASNLLSEGENVARIAKQMGHRTIDMLIKHYARWVEQGASGTVAVRRYGMDVPGQVVTLQK